MFIKIVLTACLITLGVASVRPSILQQSLGPLIPSNHDLVKVQFESGEHELIGDSLKLHFPNGSVKGAAFAYPISQGNGKAKPVSFGELVALGDYYGSYQLQGNRVPDTLSPQLSDRWLSNESEALDFFNNVSNLIRNNYACGICKTGYMPYLTNYIRQERENAMQYYKHGGDVAQFYEDNFKSIFARYVYATTDAVTLIAWQNWDHFGQDAIYAYTAGHTLALRFALLAKISGNSSWLNEAYFAEGFAQHFLTDTFSAGHLRVPRRILHTSVSSPSPVAVAPNRLRPTESASTARPTYPYSSAALGGQDRLAGYAHDEDCANGLFVENALGEQWPAYGDNQFFSEKAIANLAQARRACQEGIDEVYQVFKSGITPDASDFGALKLVPIVGSNVKTSNFQPLFTYDPDVSSHLHKRADVDQRNSTATKQLDPDKASQQDWDEWFNEVYYAREENNMYPYTKSGLATRSSLLQFRLVGSSLVITDFGNISVENTTTWNSKQQRRLSLAHILARNDTWQWISSVSSPDINHVHHLTATSPSASGRKIVVHRISILVPPDTNPPRVLWYLNNTLVCHSCGVPQKDAKVLLGHFFPGSLQGKEVGEVLVLKGGDLPNTTAPVTIAMSSFPSGPEHPPKGDLVVKVPNAYDMVRIGASFSPEVDQAAAVIASTKTSPNSSSGEPVWYFAYWSSTPAGVKANVFNVEEGSFLDRPRGQVFGTHLLALDSGLLPYLQWVVRIGHGSPDKNGTRLLHIDILVPTFVASNSMTIVSRSSYTPPDDSCIDFSIDKAHWIVTGSMASSPTLVGYIHSLAHHSGGMITVLTFEFSSSLYEFVLHSISTVRNNTDIYPPQRLVTADFMRPVNTVRVQGADDDDLDQDRWPTFMETFDNYGILGARLVGPVNGSNGTVGYELKGQTPALAGQMSTGLGWSNFEKPFGEGLGYAWAN